MTRKDYQAIAQAVAEVKQHGNEQTATAALLLLTIKLGDIFENDNPQFVGLKFREACGF